MNNIQRYSGLVCLLLATQGASRCGSAVVESPRDIPVAREVDVVVVGGSSGAASAAIAAAEQGARVFLLTPRTYLGEDMCGTLRLWLEEGETPASPLAKRVFAREPEPAELPAAAPNALPLTYKANLPSAGVHKDTTPPSRLTDGLWGRPENQSVQYDGDVVLVADLGAVKPVEQARLVLYGRGDSDFNAERVTIAISRDQRAWQTVTNVTLEEPKGSVVSAVTPINAPIRYAQFTVKRRPEAKRVLIGEIILTSPETRKPEAPPTAQPSEYTRLARPLHVKKTLEDALLEAKVDFLYSCYPTELLRDADGNPCGVVMANRSGRQAVLAKVIIDATARGTVARMAGAKFSEYPAGEQVFHRVVVGGEVQQGQGIAGRKTGLKFKTVSAGWNKAGGPPPEAELIEYVLPLPMRDGGFASFAEAEQRARDLTFHPGLLDASETLYQVPPDQMQGAAKSTGPWPGASAVALDAFRPAGVGRLYVLGGCADVAREQAGRLLRPLALMEVGARIGAAAATEAGKLPVVRGAKVAGGAPIQDAGAATGGGEIKEFLSGLRPTQKAERRLPSEARNLPVYGVYDVVVVGGGTGGAPAGIGAGRAGAKTLVLEYLHGLGGVGTMGMISKYYHGYRGGFTAEVDKGVAALGATNGIIGKIEWWRQANRKVGTEIWFGVLGCGAVVEGGMVKGVVVATPEGRGVVLAKTVIDASGNADVAAAAGAPCEYTAGDEVGVQGAGLPPWGLGAEYTNTDWTFADDTDVVDFWHHFILAKQKFPTAYDLGQLVDTRERRRIVGEVTVSPMDIILGRTWSDSLVLSKSNFDSHGFTVHPVFVAMPPDRQGLSVFVPLRALLPKGLDGILVTGLGVSAHRDAIPVIRMQPDVQNQGYACGRAAAMVARSAATIRQVDVKTLQKHLVEIGCLPESVLSDGDRLPLSREKLAQAVAEVARPIAKTNEVDGVIQNREALAMLFAQPQDSIPLLEQAYAKAAGEARLACAHILANLGSKAGADALVERIQAAKTFDKGWNYTGMGQFGRSLSELDSYLVALGRTRDPRALEVVLEKLKQLDATKEFSHHRACAVALETLGDPRAARPLAELLRKPGMSGYATPTLEEAKRRLLPSSTDNKQRNESLRELVLARALYRCGDHEGVGERILQAYVQDLRGHYSRHAQAVLAGGKGAKP